jgi:GMP reductase
MSVFDFEHMNLIPQKCIVESRSECDTTIIFERLPKVWKFNLPVVPANMQCVIDRDLAEKLASNDYFYIYHRFGSNNGNTIMSSSEDTIDFIRTMKSKKLFTSISIGVNEDSYDLMNFLRKEELIPDFITIDIAHGHSIKMENMVTWLRGNPEFEYTFIIAGNVSTSEAVKDLESWGVDACKIGIGPGRACSTYMTTGFGSRGIQASTVEECAKAKVYPRTKIIADGGITEPGDIAKSVALGADMVMVGGMFSGLIDSPGPTVSGPDGKLYKEFWGSASAHQSGKNNRIEGVKKLIPLQTRDMLGEMNYIKECLQSSISYGGGKVLQALRKVSYLIKK